MNTCVHTFDYRRLPDDAIDEIVQSVARGSEMLDNFHTNWYFFTNPDLLKMKDADCCILGQTGQSAHPESRHGYTTEVNEIVNWLIETETFPNPVADRWANPDFADTDWVTQYYGFDLPNYAYSGAGDFLWGVLDGEWIKAIRQRMDAEAKS